MIGKISIGSSFGGCIGYCLEDKKQELEKELVMKNRAELVHYNMCYGDKKELIKQFNDTSQLNPKLSKPVMHISLSLAPEDVVEKGKMAEMAEECAKSMGFEHNMYIAIYHKDTNHQHLHIVVNRVGFNGKTVSDSHNYQKMATYCRSMEQKYGLKQVLSPRRYLSHEQRQLERHDARKALLKERIMQSIRQSKSYQEFEQLMKQSGYEVIRRRGIAFRDQQKVYTKGSQVGYSLATIEKQLQRQLQFKPFLTLEQKRFLAQQRKIEKENEKVSTGHQQKKLQKPHFKKDEDLSEHKMHKHNKENILDILMKPEREDDFVPYEFRISKHKKLKH